MTRSKIKTKPIRGRGDGFSLALVLVFTGVLFLLLSGVLALTTTNANQTQRYNEYYDSVAAAEAATEKVVASMARDFQNSGVNGVDGNLANYGASIPTPAEVNDWANYQFNDPSGGPNATYVTKLTLWQYTNLNWKYTGFKGSNSTYRIISNARNTASAYGIASAVKQEIQIAAIPLFEFGVFYAPDMELCALNTDFTVPGRVHCNGTIYSMPNQVTVTFADDVTAAQQILPTKSPKDGSTWSRTLGTNIYRGEHDWNVSSLNLPLGTNNAPTNLHALIEIPPSPDAGTPLGQQRYYNKADLIILVSNTNVTSTSGAYNNFSTPVPWSNISSFVNTNVSFRNERESKTIQATQIDVAKFAANPTYNKLSSLLGQPVLILYVADLRTQTSGTESGVRLTNGIALPAAGLTVATLNPLYVLGHYNAPDTTPGSTNTGAPASLVGDAITILSGAWQDGNTSTYDTRAASNTTINAAVLAGIVPSYGTYFSGGVENFFRLLESWSSRTLTFNGSIVALFPSQSAMAPWGTTYAAPQRLFLFDPNFKNNSKLPPGTPMVCTVIRSTWNIAQPNSTQ